MIHHSPTKPGPQLLIFVQPFWMFFPLNLLFMVIPGMLCWTYAIDYAVVMMFRLAFHWQSDNTNSSDEHNHRFHNSEHNQNGESKITYDYVMMLRNNKFEHTVGKFETNNAGKILKTTTTRKETLIWNYNSIALNLNQNVGKIIDGNPYFLYFCTVLWFSNIFHTFSSFTSS